MREAQEKPQEGEGHAGPAEDAGGGGDFDVVVKNFPAEEYFVPVMVAAADEVQLEGARVFHVAGDVKEVFEEPNPCGCEWDWLPFAPKGDHEDDGKGKLAERAAVNFQALAEQSEKWMAGFVEKEVRGIEQEDEAALGFEDGD